MCEWMSQNTRTMPGRIEAYRLRLAARVAAEIESLRLRQRKDVVVGGVVVREIDDRADGDREHVRHEGLVALIHAGRVPGSSGWLENGRVAAPRLRGRRPLGADVWHRGGAGCRGRRRRDAVRRLITRRMSTRPRSEPSPACLPRRRASRGGHRRRSRGQIDDDEQRAVASEPEQQLRRRQAVAGDAAAVAVVELQRERVQTTLRWM